MPIRIRFVIVGTYRTGSSPLVDALNLHPQIACGVEWTQKRLPARALRMAERSLNGDFSVLLPHHRRQIEALLSPSTCVLGFKRLFRASNKWLGTPAFGPLIVDGLEAHIRWLARRPEVHVIHVVRNDALAWLKSKAFADATGVYAGAAYPDGMQVIIRPREAARRVRAKLHIDERLATLRDTNPYLRVEYEAFAADNDKAARAAVAFLGCDPAGLRRVDLNGSVQSKPSHRITNFEQLKRALAALDVDEA